MAHFTEKIKARALLAEKLQEEEQLERVKNARLKVTDLQLIAVKGREAEAADNLQTVQLTEGSTAVSLKSDKVKDARKREKALRDIIPAVVYDLEEAGHEADALFTARLSFARFRLRELKDTSTEGATEEETALTAKLRKVAREDMISRMDGLAALCEAFLAPGRETIVAAFAARWLEKTDLEKLAADAKELAEGGRNVLSPAEATKREREAVLVQRKKWRAVRRLIAEAVKGSDELERLWAEC